MKILPFLFPFFSSFFKKTPEMGDKSKKKEKKGILQMKSTCNHSVRSVFYILIHRNILQKYVPENEKQVYPA